MRVLWASLIVIVADQITKVVVTKTLAHSSSTPVIGDWLKLTFTENPGMAFGVTFGPPALITVFSIAATVIILVYAFSIRRGYLPYRFSLALVLGGAIGNIIDRVFYGKLLYGQPFFQGKVVDFIHVDLWRGFVNESVPVIGGNYVALFPIWNVADMAIVLGVVGILVFQRAFHRKAIERHMEDVDVGLREQGIQPHGDTTLATEAPMVSPSPPVPPPSSEPSA